MCIFYSLCLWWPSNATAQNICDVSFIQVIAHQACLIHLQLDLFLIIWETISDMDAHIKLATSKVQNAIKNIPGSERAFACLHIKSAWIKNRPCYFLSAHFRSYCERFILWNATLHVRWQHRMRRLSCRNSCLRWQRQATVANHFKFVSVRHK